MSNLSRQQFGPDEHLPGMGGMREAAPHEQTESQFHNRPDVFWHGRFDRNWESTSEVPKPRGWDFHAGTENAALERMTDLGHRITPEHEPRFFAGTVDESKMRNPSPTGRAHDLPEGQHVERFQPGLTKSYGVPKVTPSPHEWRAEDKGEDWDRSHGDQYYRNDHEDPGSTSVILHDRRRDGEELNFKPWRTHVSEALRQGQPVPHHVKGLYHDTGGADGPVVSHPVEFQEQNPPGSMDAYSRRHLPDSVRKYAVTENVIQPPESAMTNWTMGLYKNPNKKKA